MMLTKILEPDGTEWLTIDNRPAISEPLVFAKTPVTEWAEVRPEQLHGYRFDRNVAKLDWKVV